MLELLTEFDGAMLGDKRRVARLLEIVAAAARQPDATFPNMAGDDAALEGMYRFLNNPTVQYEDVASVHRARTAERGAVEEQLIVLHDTTTFQFSHADPKEIGYLQTGKPGFYAHFSLVIAGVQERRPLGVVNVETIFRTRRSKQRSRHTPGSTTSKQVDRESKRWETAVLRSKEALAQATSVVHVADREADSYSLLGLMAQNACRFVVRVRHDRVAQQADDEDGTWSTLKSLVAEADCSLKREVPLSSRAASTAPRQARAYPVRKTRVAKLHFAATTIVIRRPRYLRELPSTLTLNVVRVYEKKAPAGQEPVEWLLITTEPIATPDDIASIVDIYRTRWVIEEFFKALKTGCLYEERQLESKHALLNALAIFTPIACQLLWLRARAQIPDSPASEVLTDRQIQVLRAIAKRPMPDQPSARDALLTLAGLGGHIKNNGEPGWATLRKGLERLLSAEVGWVAARTRTKK